MIDLSNTVLCNAVGCRLAASLYGVCDVSRRITAAIEY